MPVLMSLALSNRVFISLITIHFSFFCSISFFFNHNIIKKKNPIIVNHNTK